MRGVVLLSAGLALWSSGGAAQDTTALVACGMKLNDTERLACFDAAIQAKPAAATPEAAAEPPTASTKEIVAAPPAAPQAPIPAKVVDAADVYVAPGKYEGRPIEVRKMRCFHADKNEYRCVASGSTMLALFAPTIRPDKEREGIENDCGEIRKMSTSPKCERTVRFTPMKHAEDIVSGYHRRVLVLTPEIEVLPSAARGRR